MVQLSDDFYLPIADKLIMDEKQLARTEVSLYDNSWFDLSGFALFDLSKKVYSYDVAQQKKGEMSRPDGHTGLYVAYSQSRTVNEAEYAINSLDILLGVVGGLSAVVWGGMSLVLDGYENFKLDHDLTSRVYPASAR